jgi:adenylate kinase
VFSCGDPQLLDQLEPLVSGGGVVLDWHTCDVYPERWADLVVVLRCHHTTLWDRLEKRYAFVAHVSLFPSRRSPTGVITLTNPTCLRPFSGYPLKKVQENNEAEIMGIVCDEARESYQPGIVVELESSAMEDLEENVARLVTWIDQWMKDNDGNGMDNQNSESE